MLFRWLILLGGLLFAFMPAIQSMAQPIDPATISEENLGERSLADSGLALTPDSAGTLLEKGAPSLVLHLLQKMTNRNGPASNLSEWSPIKVDALIALDRHDEALKLLMALPPQIMDSQPALRLVLAQVHLALGQWDKAKENYSLFLLQHPNHPQKFEAQLGMGLTALAAGHIDEAELLLNLYGQESRRSRTDPLLIIALARLAREKGDEAAENSHFSDLAGLILPDGSPHHRARIEALALWYGRHNRWREAFALVEQGLRDFPSPPFRQFYQDLLKQALNAYHAKKKGNDITVMTAMRILIGGEIELRRREAALDRLLALEKRSPIGLFEPGGALYSGSFLPQPLDPQLRTLLAKAHFQLQNQDQAWKLLRGVETIRADLLRLNLLAAGYHPKRDELLQALARPFTTTDKETVDALVEALMGLTQEREVEAAAVVRRLLSPLTGNLPVRRALRFQQALDKSLNGEKNSALILYLELATEEINAYTQKTADALLPTDPLLAAAELLTQMGAFQEAAELRVLGRSR